MDIDQGNDTFRKAIFLKEIWDLKENQILQLRQGHRCPEKIAHLAAQVLAIRNHVCAGDVEGKGWARQVEVSSHLFPLLCQKSEFHSQPSCCLNDPSTVQAVEVHHQQYR